ncbi:MAG: Na-translocating system protein MpsB, partial [Pseudomonadales bacterium]
AGNKLLHNVVGGRIGVFEGNTGDLRIGLPLQSLHDGQQWQHEPLRLSVFIDAPRARIETVLTAQPQIRGLIENKWLYLFRLGGEVVEAWRGDGEWDAA